MVLIMSQHLSYDSVMEMCKHLTVFKKHMYDFYWSRLYASKFQSRKYHPLWFILVSVSAEILSRMTIACMDGEIYILNLGLKGSSTLLLLTLEANWEGSQRAVGCAGQELCRLHLGHHLSTPSTPQASWAKGTLLYPKP